MNEGKRITDLEKMENVPKTSSFIMEDGDGSGTKRILFDAFLKAIAEGIKIGKMEDLSTKSHESIVEAVNEVYKMATTAFEGTDGIKTGAVGMVPAPSPEDDGKFLSANGAWGTPSGGGSLKVLKSIEELEANTEEGYLVDALLIKRLTRNMYRGTLSAGQTELQIAIGDFDDDTIVDIYTNVWGVYPTDVELRSAADEQPNLCIMKWDAQKSDVNVTVMIR